MWIHRFGHCLVLALLLTAAASCRADTTGAGQKTLGYTPPELASQQLEQARTAAAAGHKRILIVAGGDWCRWCHVLDLFLHRHPDIDSQLQASFVLVKLAVEGDGADHPVLDALPTPQGYPHFWVLSADGSLIDSVDTFPLEHGDNGYDPAKFAAFIRRYTAPTP